MSWSGHLLVATPRLQDPRFVGTVVLLCHHSDDGALGVVLNRPSDLAVADALPQWDAVVAAPRVVFFGGPVKPEVAVSLADAEHSQDPIAGLNAGLTILDDLAGPPNRLRIYSGYAGWGPGQLEEEVSEMSWWVLEAADVDVFTGDPDGLRARVLMRQRDESGFFAHFTDEPTWN